MKNWTQQEKDLLSNTSMSISDLHDKLPHRSIEAIRIKSNRMGYNRTGDAFLKKSNNYLDLLKDNNFREIIDGELLGDGCIIKNQRGYYSFAYCTSNKEYANFIHKMICQKTQNQSKVYEYGPAKPHLNPLGKLVVSKTPYQFGISHKVFKSFHERWYRNKKHIPSDLVLTPTVCRHWYIGDGHIHNKNSLVIKLSTECFTKSDIDVLIEKLCSIGIVAKPCLSYDNKFTIAIYASNALNFLKYIGECPVQSYKYKWSTNGYRKRRKKCLCGKWFHFFAHTNNRRAYCSKKCRKHYKRCNYNKQLANKKRNYLLSNSIEIKSNNHSFYYILGHMLCTGKSVSKEVVSISVLDSELIALICKILNYEHSVNVYKNTISFQSKKLANLFECLTENFNLDNISKKYHGDILRGIFDGAGIVNLNSDNYFQIVIRCKFATCLGEVLGIEPSKNNTLQVKKKQRKSVFSKLYIQNNEIRSQKKFILFKRSLSAVRKKVSKDEKGRFVNSKTAIIEL